MSKAVFPLFSTATGVILFVMLLQLFSSEPAIAVPNQQTATWGSAHIGDEVYGVAGPESLDCQDAAYLNALPALAAQRTAWLNAVAAELPTAVAIRSTIEGPAGRAVDAPLLLAHPDGFEMTVTPVDLPAPLGLNSGSNSTGIPAFANVQISGSPTGCTMQDRAPKPASAIAGDYYFNQLSNLHGLNALLFTFSEPAPGFGVFVGDLETSLRGTAAFMRLLDGAGALVADIPIRSTLSIGGGVDAENAQCNHTSVIGVHVAAQGLAPGCGNGATRWIGFVSDVPVAKVLVVVGDNDPLPGGQGLTEKLSIMGPTVVRTLPPAEVTVAKEAPAQVTAGALYNYALVISNTSSTMAAGLVLTDAAPSGVTLAAVSDSRCTLAANTLSCQLDTLAANSATTILLQATAGSTATLTNTVHISAANDENFTNNSASAAVTPNVAPALNLCAPATNGTAPALIINEVLYNELGANNDEWVELYATSDIAAGAQYYISDNEQNAGGFFRLITAPPSGIPAGTYLVIHDDNGVDDLDPSDGLIELWGAGGNGAASTSMRNSSDNMTLYVGTSEIAANAIDYMRWGSDIGDATNDDPPAGILWSGFASGDAGNAQSVVRLRNGVDGSRGADWALAGEQGTVAPFTLGAHNAGLSRCNVAVAKSGPVSAPLGSPFAYTITVQNRSNVTMTAVTISDTQPVGLLFQSVSGVGCNLDDGELTCTLGELAPNGSQTITLTALANAAQVITNTVYLTASGDSFAADNRSSHRLSVQEGGAIGDYLYLDANGNGVQDVDEITPIHGVLVTLTAANGSQMTQRAEDGLYHFAHLPAGPYTVTVGSAEGYRLTSAGSYVLTLAPGQLITAADFGFMYEEVDVAVTKQGPASAALAGNLVYTLQVTNLSATAPALDLVVIDRPPAGIRLITVEDPQCALVESELICNLGAVAPGAAAQITVTAQAVEAGEWENHVQVSGANEVGGANNGAASSTRVVTTEPTPAPALKLDKSVVAPAVGVVKPGEKVTYALHVLNSGAITVSQITLVDRYDPAYVQFNSASLAPTLQAAGALTWTLATEPLPLSPGEGMTITVQFTALQPQ